MHFKIVFQISADAKESVICLMITRYVERTSNHFRESVVSSNRFITRESLRPSVFGKVGYVGGGMGGIFK